MLHTLMAFLQSNLWLLRIYFITRFTVDNNQGRCSLTQHEQGSEEMDWSPCTYMHVPGL